MDVVEYKPHPIEFFNDICATGSLGVGISWRHISTGFKTAQYQPGRPKQNTKLDCKPKLLNVQDGPCLHSFPDNMDDMGHKITKPIQKQLRWVE